MVWSRLVTAITLWPRALAASATPRIEPFTPEFEAMMKTSWGWMSNSASRFSPMSGSRSNSAPPRSETLAAAAQHQRAQLNAVGRDQPAGAARDLHRERLGVTGAERLDHAARLERVGDQRDGVVDRLVGLGETLEARRRLLEILGSQVGHHQLGSLDNWAAARGGRNEAAPRSGRRRGATAAPEAARSRVVRSKFDCAIRR